MWKHVSKYTRILFLNLALFSLLFFPPPRESRHLDIFLIAPSYAVYLVMYCSLPQTLSKIFLYPPPQEFITLGMIVPLLRRHVLDFLFKKKKVCVCKYHWCIKGKRCRLQSTITFSFAP